MGGKSTNTHSFLTFPSTGYLRRESPPDRFESVLDRLLEPALDLCDDPPVDLLLDFLLPESFLTFGLDFCTGAFPDEPDFLVSGRIFVPVPPPLVEGLGRTAWLLERSLSPGRAFLTEPLASEPSFLCSWPD